MNLCFSAYPPLLSLTQIKKHLYYYLFIYFKIGDFIFKHAKKVSKPKVLFAWLTSKWLIPYKFVEMIRIYLRIRTSTFSLRNSLATRNSQKYFLPYLFAKFPLLIKTNFSLLKKWYLVAPRATSEIHLIYNKTIEVFRLFRC